MKIVLKKSDAAEPFTFAFLGEDGKTIVRSENYKEKRSAINGIESVKKNCLTDARYEMKEAKNGKLFFNLKAVNGQAVGTSMMFATVDDRDKAIAELKGNAPDCAVDDEC